MNTENNELNCIDAENTPDTVDVKKKSGLGAFFCKMKDRISKSPYLYIVGAFFLPLLIMLGAHAAASFYPFGNSSILSLDFQAQYIYYFEELRSLLTEGGSWLYTWSRTLGGEFMGYLTYYLGSPFNLLVVLFPEKHIAMAVSFIVLVKIGAMGATFAIYLHKTRRPSEMRTLIFSAMYALCGYVAVQQYNPMWLDAVIWLPLLVLGIERLIKDKKIILYIVSLSLILTANYYIGYMCCIFTLIYFVCYYILVRPELVCENEGKKNFFSYVGTRAFFRIAFATVVAMLISAFMLLSAYYSLTFGKTGFSNPNFDFKFKFDLLDIFVKMLPGSYDTVRDNGLPLVYSGVLSIILLPVFYMSNSISSRRKIIMSALLGVLLVSFLINPIDLAWHGFSAPNWLNFRYSFIFSFVVIVMACDAFESMESVSFGKIGASAACALVLVAIVQKFGYSFKQGTKTLELDDLLCIGLSALFILAYIAILYALKKGKAKETVTLILAVTVCVELFANSIISVGQLESDVGYVKYNNYSKANSNKEMYDSYSGSVERMRVIYDQIRVGDAGFFRTESTLYRQRGGVNEQMAVGFNGISASTSTLNKSVIRLMCKMGYASTSHWTKYLGGTPVGDALFGIKYIITGDVTTEPNGATIGQNNTHLYDPNFYVKMYETDEPYQIYPSGNTLYAMKNTKALSIAYGVSRNLLDYDGVFSMATYKTAQDTQNEIINTMLSEVSSNINVWKPLKMEYDYKDCIVNVTNIGFTWDGEPVNAKYYVITKSDNGTDPSITFETTAVTDGIVYLHMPTADFGKTAKLYVNGKSIRCGSSSDYFSSETTCVLEIGEFKTGDEIKVRLELNSDKLYIAADSESYLWYIDADAANEAFSYLESSSMVVEDYDNDRLSGYIYVEEGQELVFTTIPYDTGWHVYVDGKEVEYEEVLDSLMAFEVEAGYHEIEMRYFPTIYKIGIVLSTIGILMLALIIAYSKSEKIRSLLTIKKKSPSCDVDDNVAELGDENK